MDDQLKINDFHIHIGKSDDPQYDINLERLLFFKKHNDIDKMLIMGSHLNPEADNESVKQYTKEDGIYGLHWWTTESNDIKFDDKIVGIKYHGAYLKRPVTSMDSHVLETMDKHKKILLVHCGRYLEARPVSNTAFTHALQVAQSYRHIKVVLAHMGGTDRKICKEAIDAAVVNDGSVYFDTSGITTPSIIEYACNKLPCTRILFGSDWPWCGFKSMYHNVYDALINDLTKQDILYNNFEMLLR